MILFQWVGCCFLVDVQTGAVPAGMAVSQALMMITKKEGPLALFKGALPRALWVSPLGTAINWLVLCVVWYYNALQDRWNTDNCEIGFAVFVFCLQRATRMWMWVCHERCVYFSSVSWRTFEETCIWSMLGTDICTCNSWLFPCIGGDGLRRDSSVIWNRFCVMSIVISALPK